MVFGRGVPTRAAREAGAIWSDLDFASRAGKKTKRIGVERMVGEEGYRIHSMERKTDGFW